MHKWSPLVAVSLGTFMLVLDINIVVVALPTIGAELDASTVELQWIVDLYALVIAALLLAAGGLADRCGHRGLYLAGSILFGLASLACALAPTPTALVAARGVQALGSIAMLATSAALISLTYDGRERATAFGVWAGAASLGSALGPIIGGVLTELLGWRWIFAVNVPVVAVIVLVTVLAVPSIAGRTTGRFDLIGVAAFGTAAAGIVHGLNHSVEDGWAAPLTWTPLIIGALALTGFVAHELRTDHPAFDVRLLKEPAFTALLVAGTALNAAAFGMLPFASVWMQSVLLAGPLHAGIMLMPLAVASLVTSLTLPRIAHRLGPRPMIGGGLLLIAVGAALAGLVQTGSSGWALTPALTLVGLGTGAVLPSLTGTTLASAPADRAGMAGAALNTARSLGYAVGFAVFAVVVTAHVPGGIGAASPASAGDVVAGLHAGFNVAAGIAAAGALTIAIGLRPARRPVTA
ncbi:MFS transporter [Actinomycetes bacterium KLBMP 9759]